jgi:hypothetical protein
VQVREFLLTAITLVALSACGDPTVATPRAAPSPTPESISDVLSIVCHEDGSTELMNNEVRASEDGVHVSVDNRAGASWVNGLNVNAPHGASESVAIVAPGKMQVSCHSNSHLDPEPKGVSITVSDPESYWVPAELECPGNGPIAQGIFDFIDDATGIQGDLVQITRDEQKKIKPRDEVFKAGYPAGGPHVVAVARDGKVIATFGYIPSEDGGWLVETTAECGAEGAGL